MVLIEVISHQVLLRNRSWRAKMLEVVLLLIVVRRL